MRIVFGSVEVRALDAPPSAAQAEFKQSDAASKREAPVQHAVKVSAASDDAR